MPHLDFDLDRCSEYARQVNPGIEILAVSARTGEGLDAWYDWLGAAAGRARAEPFPATADVAVEAGRPSRNSIPDRCGDHASGPARPRKSEENVACREN